MYLDGRGLRHRDRRGELIMDDSFLLLLHAGDQGGRFTLPGAPWADQYVPVDRHQPARRRTRRTRGRSPAGTAAAASARAAVLLLRAEREHCLTIHTAASVKRCEFDMSTGDD